MYSDPFAAIRSLVGDPAPAAIVTPEPIATPESAPDLFAGSEPVNIAAANAVAAVDATPPVPTVVTAEAESITEQAILALHDRLSLLETMARRNGWSL